MNTRSDFQRQIPEKALRVVQWSTVAVAVIAAILAVKHGRNFMVTADQRGQRLMDSENYAEAAEAFDDPYRQAVAFFRAGDYEKAASWFGGLPSAEAAYGQGNSLVMLGKYDDAIAQYNRALKMRPGWKAAMTNRDIAVGRAKRMEFEGGDMTGGQMGADGITFDKAEPSGDQTVTVEGGAELGDKELRALWLRQVQTTPSDFLKAKFAYQNAMQSKESGDE